MDLLPVVFRIHRQIIEKRIHKSFIYHGVYAPWAHMDCLSIYGIYLELNIGYSIFLRFFFFIRILTDSYRSPKDVHDIVMDCLNAMEKKVDAAFGNTQ